MVADEEIFCIDFIKYNSVRYFKNKQNIKKK